MKWWTDQWRQWWQWTGISAEEEETFSFNSLSQTQKINYSKICKE